MHLDVAPSRLCSVSNRFVLLPRTPSSKHTYQIHSGSAKYTITYRGQSHFRLAERSRLVYYAITSHTSTMPTERRSNAIMENHTKSVARTYRTASPKKIQSELIYSCAFGIYFVSSVYAWSPCVGSPVNRKLSIFESKFVWCSAESVVDKKSPLLKSNFGQQKHMHAPANRLSTPLNADAHTHYKWYFRQIYVKR